MYVCGYAAHAVSRKLNCNICISLVCHGKGEKADNEYFDHLQRGGLSIPTDNMQYLFFHMCSIFEAIINNNKYESRFKTSQKQKHILMKLTTESIRFDFWFNDFNCVCICGQNCCAILNMVLSIYANIILNNYVKNINNQALQSKKRNDPNLNTDKNKKRKLLSLSK